jgi:putative addiction module component (TIGR02574 family)
LILKWIAEILTFTDDMNLPGTKIELTPAQKTELNRRLDKYDRGEMRFKTWEETKKGIRRRAKNAA